MNAVVDVLYVAEKRFRSAAWDWYNANKASVKWDLTTINPPYVSSGNLTPSCQQVDVSPHRYLA